MARKRKYPKINGSCVYVHSMLGLDYFGSTGDKLCNRWGKSDYKHTALQPYIEKVGWENIEHRVIKDGLTPEEAIELENKLIKDGWKNGTCINLNETQYDIKEYHKEYYKNNKQSILDYNNQRLSKTEGKIYNRVTSFNRYHPERKIITALEAKEMYLLTGYIPDFIKNDDLI